MTACVSALAFVAFTVSATRFPTTTRLLDEFSLVWKNQETRQIDRINGPDGGRWIIERVNPSDVSKAEPGEIPGARETVFKYIRLHPPNQTRSTVDHVSRTVTETVGEIQIIEIVSR